MITIIYLLFSITSFTLAARASPRKSFAMIRPSLSINTVEGMLLMP